MNRNKRIAVTAVLLVVAVAAGSIAFTYYGKGSRKYYENHKSETQSAQVSAEAVKDSGKADITEAGKNETETAATGTTIQVTDYRLPFTVREAMDALMIHYGSDYEINSTVEENGLNYFSVYHNGERYASVSVDLVTGQAVETLAQTGAETNFSLI